MTVSAPPAIGSALGGVEQWLETMRGPGGYGGPVAHWWRDSVVYCGPGLDWRYEGIISGYLEMFRTSGNDQWLARARAAGDDLLAGQLTDAGFQNSGFEQNPRGGGTPHEAAADIGLLRLAGVLRDCGGPSWEPYLSAAERNLTLYHIGRLWDAEAQLVRDDPAIPSFVPNKAATVVEALILLAQLTGRSEYLDRYVRPTVDAIVKLQVHRAGDSCDGAIAQNTLRDQVVAKYFPFYQARCIPAFVAAYETLGLTFALEAAAQAMAFILRWRDSDGALPQVVYPGGRTNRYPRWIAATGDVLRAIDLLRPHGLADEGGPSLDWLLQGQESLGGFRTADGFAAQTSQRPQAPPDWRDLLPVAGWNDKAFRYFATLSSEPDLSHPSVPVDLPCTFFGTPAHYHEDQAAISVHVSGALAYQWQKGSQWAETPGLASGR